MMIDRALLVIMLTTAGCLAPPAPLAAQSDTDIHLLELSRDGDLLMVAGPPRPVTDRDGYDNQPQFTPGGSLLYTSIRDGQADSYRYDPATRRTVRLTRTAESEYSPTPVPGTDRFSVVRVEADSAQRLWSFDPAGEAPRLVLPDVEPVGYHAWVHDDLVALFVLGDPPTLRIAHPSTRASRTVAAGIGRSLQPTPEVDAVTFTQEVGGRWWLREYRVGLDTLQTVAPLLGPDEYHAWLPDGTLLTAHGTEILVFEPTTGEWTPFVDLGDAGLRRLSRLAASPDGRLLAVVAERGGR